MSRSWPQTDRHISLMNVELLILTKRKDSRVMFTINSNFVHHDQTLPQDDSKKKQPSKIMWDVVFSLQNKYYSEIEVFE